MIEILQRPHDLHIWNTCNHPSTAVRFRLNIAGQKFFKHQCLTCGRNIGKNQIIADQPVPHAEWDYALEPQIRGDYVKARQGFIDAKDAQLQKQQDAWSTTYQAYLQSHGWQSKRIRVLARCNRVCEACLQNIATEVHHTEYPEVLGTEPLWTLRGVCRSCHAGIHGRDV